MKKEKGVPFYETLCIICVIVGGLAAVIYTDTLQTFFMVIGALILMAIS